MAPFTGQQASRTSRPARVFKLTQLPAELCVMIFEDFLHADEEVHIKQKGTGDQAICRGTTRVEVKSRGVIRRKKYKAAPFLPKGGVKLLETSRQTCEEAMHVLYSKTRFVIRDATAFRTFVKTSPRGMTHIRHLQITATDRTRDMRIAFRDFCQFTDQVL